MMKCYQPDYPRPQFVRDENSWENLNGEWDFLFDDHNGGIAKKWFNGFPSAETLEKTVRKITVPYCYESPMSGIGDTARHDVVWYRRTIGIEAAKNQGRKIFLHFEGSDYKTMVWVNGVFVGLHEGGYSRFSFDITPLVKTGANTLTVRAQDSFDISQPRGKQRWRNDSFGCWYVQTTGIWKTVWLEYVNPEYLKSVKMTPVLSRGLLEIEAEVETSAAAAAFASGTAGAAGLELTAEITFNDQPVTVITIPVNEKRPGFAANVYSNVLMAWKIAAWSPSNPNLYDIVFSLKKNGRTVDRVFSYFGMREIRIDGQNILLNGTPLYQRLILDQGYWKNSHLTPPGEQALIDDIDRIMAAGYNGVRKHQKIEDEKFLYWADVKGLLVWSEMAAAYEFNDAAVTMFTREWMEIVRQNYNHPSIITWTPFNESWGVPQIKTDKTQQAFTEAIYYLTKSYDRYRPVICNDGWEHTISDIITLHDYVEKGDEFLERYGNYLQEILDNEIYNNLHRSAFADGYSYRGQPIILSEFGGIAFTNRGEGWGYGNKVASIDDYISRFDAITTAIKQIDSVCGYCYTQVTDVQQEVNGIMDMDRNFKADPEILREINERNIGVLHRIKQR